MGRRWDFEGLSEPYLVSLIFDNSVSIHMADPVVVELRRRASCERFDMRLEGAAPKQRKSRSKKVADRQTRNSKLFFGLEYIPFASDQFCRCFGWPLTAF